MTSEERIELNNIACNGRDVKFARRAQVILASNAGTKVRQITQVMRYSELQVRRIIHIFNKGGIDGIRPRYQGGRLPTFTEEQRRIVIELAKSRPGNWGHPSSQWSLAHLQLVLIKQKKISYISRPTIRTILREAGFTYQRTNTWKQSKKTLMLIK